MADLDDVTDVAKTKAGGMPVWVWGAVVVAVVMGYSWFKRRQAASAPVTMTGDVFPEGAPSGVGLPVSPGIGGTNGQASLSGPDWFQQALNQATASGINPTTALQALSSFMEGNPLTSSQADIVSGLITSTGLPPNFDPSSFAGPTSSDIQQGQSDALTQALAGMQDSVQQQLAQLQQSTSQQLDAITQSTSEQIAAIKPATVSAPSVSTKRTPVAAIANAQTLAQNLNRSVQTAYGWVTPTGTVTKTDITSQKKHEAKALAQNLGRPVKTAFGYVTSNGLTYDSLTQANAAMKKLK